MELLLQDATKLKLWPPVVCADGFKVSIQNTKFHHSDENTFELGFPNMIDELILPYAEDPEHPLETVYSYVPRSVVQELILKHNNQTLELRDIA